MKPAVVITGIATGGPIGLLVGFLFAHPGEYGVLQFLSVVGIAAAIAGSTQALVVRSRLPHATNRPRWLGLLAALTFSGAVGTVTAGFVAFWLPTQATWRRLPPPPGRPLGLAGPRCYDFMSSAVYIRTAAGGEFRIAPESEAAAWAAVDSIPVEASELARGFCDPGPAAPAELVPILIAREEGADCGGSATFALRKDGSVWASIKHDCALVTASLFIVAVPLSALLAAGVCGALFLTRPPPGLAAS